MGSFDTIYMYCPSCGTQLEFQSKSGDCHLREYRQHDVPTTVSVGADSDVQACPNCRQLWTFRVPRVTPILIREG